MMREGWQSILACLSPLAALWPPGNPAAGRRAMGFASVYATPSGASQSLRGGDGARQRSHSHTDKTHSNVLTSFPWRGLARSSVANLKVQQHVELSRRLRLYYRRGEGERARLWLAMQVWLLACVGAVAAAAARGDVGRGGSGATNPPPLPQYVRRQQQQQQEIITSQTTSACQGGPG